MDSYYGCSGCGERFSFSLDLLDHKVTCSGVLAEASEEEEEEEEEDALDDAWVDYDTTAERLQEAIDSCKVALQTYNDALRAHAEASQAYEDARIAYDATWARLNGR